MGRRDDTPEAAWLAWAGWRLRAPGSWRPHNIRGDWRRGELLAGDGDAALLQLKWRRTGRRFRAAAWLERRLRRLNLARLPARAFPSDGAFRWSEWATRGEDLVIWYGYAEPSRLLLEAALRRTGEADGVRMWERVGLPSLAVDAPGEPVRWSVFGSSFITPPGHVLRAWQVNLGDIALRVGAGARRVTVRQVYPGAQALERRRMAIWLKRSPFPERRVFRSRREPEPWSVALADGGAEGLMRRGVKRLPQPLGLAIRKEHLSAGVYDAGLDRLLCAEIEDRRPPDPAELEQLLRDMNWAIRGGETA